MVSQSMTRPSAVGVERFDVRVGLVVLSAVFYALTFLPLYELFGRGVVSLSSVPVALAGWLFGLRAGMLAGTVAETLREVTDRLQGELEKKLDGEGNQVESEERRRHLVENPPGMQVTVGVDGTIIYAHRAIGGLSQTQLPGANVYNFVPRSHQTLFRRTLEKVFTPGEQGGYEIADQAKVGTPTLHIIRFGPVVEDDQVVAETLLGLDVTDTVG